MTDEEMKEERQQEGDLCLSKSSNESPPMFTNQVDF